MMTIVASNSINENPDATCRRRRRAVQVGLWLTSGTQQDLGQRWVAQCVPQDADKWGMRPVGLACISSALK